MSRPPDPEVGVWVNGLRGDLSQATVSVADPAFQSGLGTFETLALRDGLPIDLRAHLDRLFRSAPIVGVELPGRERLVEVCTQAASAQPAAFGWMKIIVTRAERWFVFTGSMDPADEGRSVSAVLLPWRRNPADPLTGVKSLNYGASMLGLQEAQRRGADEGIWLNTRGHLAEGCTSNLFILEGRKLFTPSAGDGVLPGVVRGQVLHSARDRGLTLHEGKIRLKRLLRAPEAFLTSSLRGVRPLVKFEGKPVGRGRPGDLTRQLARDVMCLRGQITETNSEPSPTESSG